MNENARLWCATTNAGKLREFRLAGANVEAVPAMRDIPPSPEDGATFEENAEQKAIYYSRFTEGLLLRTTQAWRWMRWAGLQGCIQRVTRVSMRMMRRTTLCF